MDFKQRPRSPYRQSVDGFGRRPVARPAFSPPIQHPTHPVTRPIPKPTSTSQASPQQPIASGRSLMNAALPNPTFNRQFTAPEAPRNRKKGGHFWNRNKSVKKKWSKKRKFSMALLAVVGCMLLFGGYIGAKIIGDLDKVFHGNVASDASALFSNVTLKGEAQGRVNILVAGDSSDRVDPAANGGELTDSIMILSINTKDHSAFMLSVPRDLWVNVPNEGWAKINSTYENNGMNGFSQLVTQDLGVPIDYYALVNYQAFEDLVNAVGGISVDIQSPDPRGLYDPQPYPGATVFKLPNGWQTLNGQQALNLARARGDGYGSYGFPQSDFNRTQHQRQMVIALASKAKSAGVVGNPLKISQIFDALSKNVQTNLTLPDALELVKLMKNVNLNSIQSEAYTYGGTNPMLVGYAAPDGEEALAPAAGPGNYTQLQAFYQQLTSNNPVVKEDVSVVVLNASDAYGVAAKESTVLKNAGFNVTGSTDAVNGPYPNSMIVDMSGGKDPASLKQLQSIFSTNTITTTVTTSPAEAAEAQNYNATFVVVLGQNWDKTQ